MFNFIILYTCINYSYYIYIYSCMRVNHCYTYILYFLYFTAYMYTIQYIYVQVHQRVVNGVHATASSGSKCIFYSAEILAKA